jgi:hypothetical protein
MVEMGAKEEWMLMVDTANHKEDLAYLMEIKMLYPLSKPLHPPLQGVLLELPLSLVSVHHHSTNQS